MERYLSENTNIELDNGVYTIKQMLGRGGVCAAYLAEHDGQECIVKEFNPAKYDLKRDENGLIVDVKYKENYQTDLERFIGSAELQKKIRYNNEMTNSTPYIIEACEKYNTGYICVANQAGDTFEQKISKMSMLDKLKVCLACAKLVNEYHDHGFLCLDIKPSNIFVLQNTLDYITYIDYDSMVMKEEISFLSHVSSTKNWAAAELRNPYSWNRISEQADIYSIGEMVFNSVFERNSETWEHRSFSTYPFEKIDSDKLRSPVVQSCLTKIFRGTLRSAPENRFSSCSELIVLLEDLIKELSKEHLLIRRHEIQSSACFVGRERELKEIEVALGNTSTVFITGMGGIGKSELVRRYVELHKHEYNNIVYLTYDGNIEKTICNETELHFTDLFRYTEESDKQYSKRKLKALDSELGTDNSGKKNIIILDDLTDPLYEIADNDAWNTLQDLNAHLIVTTRNNPEKDKTVIEITEMSDENELIELFRKNANIKIDDDKLDHVKKIIRNVEGHTLIVKLIANQMEASHISDPKEMYDKLVKNGVFGLEKDDIVYNNKKAPIDQHVRRLFEMIDLSEEQIFCLSQMALMPVSGISAESFKKFWAHKKYNVINSMIKSGWISSNDNHLTMHSIIREMIVDDLKKDSDLSIRIFHHAKIGLARDYDEIDYGESDLTLLRNITKGSEEFIPLLFERSYIKQRDYKIICDSIASCIVLFEFTENTGDFLRLYFLYFKKYGNYSLLITIITLEIMKTKESEDFLYVNLLYYYYALVARFVPEIRDKLIKIVQVRLNKAIQRKDDSWIFLWYSVLYRIPQYKSYKYMHDMNNYFKKALKNNYHLDLLYLAYAECFEELESNSPFYKKLYLKQAIHFRKILLENDNITSGETSILFHIDKAKLLFLQGKRKEAINSLKNIVDYFETRDILPNVALTKVYLLLAKFLFKEGNYQEAKINIDKYYEASNKVEISSPNDLIVVHFMLAYIHQTNNNYIESDIEIQKCDRLDEVFIRPYNPRQLWIIHFKNRHEGRLVGFKEKIIRYKTDKEKQ